MSKPKVVYVVTGEIGVSLHEEFYLVDSPSEAARTARMWEDQGAVYTEIMDEIPFTEETVTHALLGY